MNAAEEPAGVGRVEAGRVVERHPAPAGRRSRGSSAPAPARSGPRRPRRPGPAAARSRRAPTARRGCAGRGAGRRSTAGGARAPAGRRAAPSRRPSRSGPPRGARPIGPKSAGSRGLVERALGLLVAVERGGVVLPSPPGRRRASATSRSSARTSSPSATRSSRAVSRSSATWLGLLAPRRRGARQAKKPDAAAEQREQAERAAAAAAGRLVVDRARAAVRAGPRRRGRRTRAASPSTPASPLLLDRLGGELAEPRRGRGPGPTLPGAELVAGDDRVDALAAAALARSRRATLGRVAAGRVAQRARDDRDVHRPGAASRRCARRSCVGLGLGDRVLGVGVDVDRVGRSAWAISATASARARPRRAGVAAGRRDARGRGGERARARRGEQDQGGVRSATEHHAAAASQHGPAVGVSHASGNRRSARERRAHRPPTPEATHARPRARRASGRSPRRDRAASAPTSAPRAACAPRPAARRPARGRAAGRTSPPPRAAGRRGATERSSPVRPTSPNAASGGASGPPPTATPRAARRDGQRDREVGARLVDPHAADDVDEDVRGARPPTPAWRPSTASTSARRLRSMPLTTRRGGTSSDGETSAWTSTSSGRVPSIDGEHDRARRARRLADEPRARVEHLDQAARAHLEHAALVRRAEAVLQRAQRPVGPLALALELQDAVDEVLEHARAGERALLRHVADEQHRDRVRLGDLHDPRGDLAHLADRARARRSAPTRAGSGPSR